ncbi:TIGR04211 family SH3 domain-containing protein [Desulfospira joergensenii]|uniref:TIGR04211 family SH3 domain-containing protein n=1 Tax=Desulfospira joergensenii TaxID=53329 RepID=UPI0003B6F98C|nr:TIGR04211 family SH3 domain-containing protein [Desulfospira joergensenii]
MRKSLICFLMFGLSLLGPGFAGAAQDIYVRGIAKITMRTGPGVDHKIVAMLTSGTKLEVVDFQDDWSQVKTGDDKIGWVLTRFLTEDAPLAQTVEKLKKENESLAASLEKMKEKSRELARKNSALVDIEQKYKELKQESADFLKLDAEYKKLVQLSEEQKLEITSLEQNLNNEEKLWFLSGAGVFIVGLFLGLSTRKKKKNSLL